MQNQIYEINLVEIARLLAYRWKVVVISMIVCMAAAYVYTSRPATQYAVDMSFTVGTTTTIKSSSVSSVSGSADSLFGAETTINKSDEEKKLSTAFADAARAAQYCGTAVKSDAVLQAVIEALGWDSTPSELSGSISTTAADGIPVLQVTVTRSDAEEALLISQKIAELAPAIITDVTKINDVNVLSAPSHSYAVSKPFSRNVMLGAVLGFILSAAILIVRYWTNTLIRKEEEITNVLGVKVLGVIPAAKEGTENV